MGVLSAGSGLLAGTRGAPGPELRSEFPNPVLSSLGVATLGMSHSGDPAARSRLCCTESSVGSRAPSEEGRAGCPATFHCSAGSGGVFPVNPTCSRLQPHFWKVMLSYVETSKTLDRLGVSHTLDTDGSIWEGTKFCHRKLPNSCF